MKAPAPRRPGFPRGPSAPLRSTTRGIAAATSTGGMTAKRWGRVGDSPIIGAGTYAANDCCAVSATGHGEFFIRAAVAHEIASLVRYAGLDVDCPPNASSTNSCGWAATVA